MAPALPYAPSRPNRRRRSVAVLALSLAAAGCTKRHQGVLDAVVIGEAPAVTDSGTAALGPADRLLRANTAQGLVRFDANGEIVAGLAEQWSLSNDGLSYIFRLANQEWPDGSKIKAADVAALLSRQLRRRGIGSEQATIDALGSVIDVRPMTDRVIEIRLAAPRPNLLPLLAQPEMAIRRKGVGTGPYDLVQGDDKDGASAESALRLVHRIDDLDGGAPQVEQIHLAALPVRPALARFLNGKADLVLGGTAADLPLAQRAGLPRGTLRFDPVIGLFGLRPARADGPLERLEVRQLLAQAIDRDALVQTYAVDGLVGRATLLQAGLDGVPAPTPPRWTSVPLAERRADLVARARQLFGSETPVEIRLQMPEGAGSADLVRRLARDWAPLGVKIRISRGREVPDLTLVDLVAPSTSPAWFLRRFRCAETPICSKEADQRLDEARAAQLPAQRNALILLAAQKMDDEQLFLPLSAPIRWSLVGPRATGFMTNIYAAHTLVGLGQVAGGR